MGGRGGGSSIASKAAAPSAAPVAAPAPAPAPAPVASQPLEQQMLDAIRNGRGLHFPEKKGMWHEVNSPNLVMLDSIRSQLPHLSFDEVTAELKRLDRARRIQLVTHPAGHFRLTEREKAATFRMGGKEIHAVYRV